MAPDRYGADNVLRSQRRWLAGRIVVINSAARHERLGRPWLPVHKYQKKKRKAGWIPRRGGDRREEATLRSQTNFTFDIFSVRAAPWRLFRCELRVWWTFTRSGSSRDRRAEGSNARRAASWSVCYSTYGKVNPSICTQPRVAPEHSVTSRRAFALSLFLKGDFNSAKNEPPRRKSGLHIVCKRVLTRWIYA